MAKQVIECNVILSTGEQQHILIPRGAELLHVSGKGMPWATLCFVGDPDRPWEAAHIVDIVVDDLLSIPSYPYYVGTVDDRGTSYHLFSDRPLDPYNPRHYTNAQ